MAIPYPQRVPSARIFPASGEFSAVFIPGDGRQCTAVTDFRKKNPGPKRSGNAQIQRTRRRRKSPSRNNAQQMTVMAAPAGSSGVV